MTATSILAGMTGLMGLISFVTFVIALINLFQNEGTGEGILGNACGPYIFS